MAIVQGDIVTPKLTSTGSPSGTYGPVITPQPIRTGVADDVPADVNVLWNESGVIQTAIDPTSLDVLDPPESTEQTRLEGKFVRVEDAANWSPEYQGIVSALYRRDPAGAGTPGATLALVLLVNTGLYLEIPSAKLTVVAGR